LWSDIDRFVDLSGTLQFDAPDVVLPGATDAAVRIGVSAPFVLSGQVAGFARGAAAGSAPVFQLLLLGSGTATLHLMRSTDGVYRFPEVTYEVTSAATPEPVVFILLATGLVSLPTCMRRSRAFRRRYTMPS